MQNTEAVKILGGLFKGCGTGVYTVSAHEIEPGMISGKAMLTVTRPDGTKHNVEMGPPISIHVDGDIFTFDYGYVVEVGEEVIIRFSLPDI